MGGHWLNSDPYANAGTKAGAFVPKRAKKREALDCAVALMVVFCGFTRYQKQNLESRLLVFGSFRQEPITPMVLKSEIHFHDFSRKSQFSVICFSFSCFLKKERKKVPKIPTKNPKTENPKKPIARLLSSKGARK